MTVARICERPLASSAPLSLDIELARTLNVATLPICRETAG
jgi:hypothetical protein